MIYFLKPPIELANNVEIKEILQEVNGSKGSD